MTENLTLGLLAHVDAGKTTLGEALLYRSGAIRKLGRVDHSDSTMDFDELERRRGITIYSKQGRLSHRGLDITLLDTPGHVDFSAEAERTLGVLDCALLLVSGSEGVQSHTETLWDLLQRYSVPALVFVSKMDLSEASPAELCLQMSQRLGSTFVDLAAEGAWEQCAETDEEALDEFLDAGALSSGTLRRLVSEQKIVPCFFGSALKLEGIDQLLDGIAQLAPTGTYPDAFSARVYKITHDRQGNRLTWLKVTGGTLAVKQLLGGEKVNQIRLYSGEKFETADAVEAGQVCAVTGLTGTHAGDCLGETAPQRPEAVLKPVLASSVLLNGCDAHKVHEALKTLTDEDPALSAAWDEDLQELRVQLMGTIQQEVLKAALLERFGFDIDFGPASILYKETIASPATGIGHFEPLRHYAEVQLRLEPMPRGSGTVFGTCCHTDELDLNWQRLILTNAMEREHKGVLTGAGITDIKVTLLAGRAHAKHTEGGDFRQATYRAIRQGLMQAESVLLEPWYSFRLRVPAKQVGRALGDLQRMAARFDAPGTQGDFAVIEGTVAASEVMDYPAVVGSYTHGLGSIALQPKGYEPCHNAEEVIAAAGYDPCADLPNTPDSVFCSHGAGYTVKWDEVPAMAHTDAKEMARSPWREADQSFFSFKR